MKSIKFPKSLEKIDFKKVFENCTEIKIEIEEDSEYQITSSYIAVATKSRTKSNIIEKVKHLFSKIKEQISNIGDR